MKLKQGQQELIEENNNMHSNEENKTVNERLLCPADIANRILVWAALITLFTTAVASLLTSIARHKYFDLLNLFMTAQYVLTNLLVTMNF